MSTIIDYSVSRNHTRNPLVLSENFTSDTVIIENRSDFPDTWVYLGYAFKLRFYGDMLVCSDSRRLMLDFPTDLSSWANSEGWKIAIKLNRWLWNEKPLGGQADPVNIRLTVD